MDEHTRNYNLRCRKTEREALRAADDRLLNFLSIISLYISTPEMQSQIIEVIESHDRFMELAERSRRLWEEP